MNTLARLLAGLALICTLSVGCTSSQDGGDEGKERGPSSRPTSQPSAR